LVSIRRRWMQCVHGQPDFHAYQGAPGQYTSLFVTLHGRIAAPRNISQSFHCHE
jgi:hypothetical protein